MLLYVLGALFMLGLSLPDKVVPWYGKLSMAIIWPIALGVYAYHVAESIRRHIER